MRDTPAILMRQTNLDIDLVRSLGQWPGLKALDQLAMPPRDGNFFRECRRIIRNEGVHSDLLAWLLTPSGSHGLGDSFASAFLQLVRARCASRGGQPESLLSGLRDEHPDHIEVMREFPTLRGPIDICVQARWGSAQHIVVGVENKVDSALSEDQLRRYEKGLRSQFPDQVVLLVYVTLKGDRPDPDDAPTSLPWCAASYRDVAEILEGAIDSSRARTPLPSQEGHGLWLAAQYLSLLREDLLNENENEIERICRDLYNAHRDAWRVIRRYLPSFKDELHEAVGRQCCELLQRRYGGEWHFIVRRNGHADVYSKMWRDYFGPYRKDRLSPRLWLAADHQPHDLSAVHVRVSTDIDDEAKSLHVATRLKVRGTAVIKYKDHKLLRDALRRVAKFEKSEWPASGEKTLSIKTSKLNGVPDESPDGIESAALKVADWVTRHALQPKKIVETVNAVAQLAKG